MTYVDGFILVVPKDRVEDYRAMAEKAGHVWKEHGALSYRECMAEDLTTLSGVSFNKLASAGDNDVVFFSYIEYKSREHRDEVNEKVMADERIKDSCGNQETMPFDINKMSYGGFQSIVDL